jgi:hypothetical protein
MEDGEPSADFNLRNRGDLFCLFSFDAEREI